MITTRTIQDIEINQVQGTAVRLIHNDKKVITAFLGDNDSVTETIQKVAEFDTPQEAYAWVIKQGLEFDESLFVEHYGQDEVNSWKSKSK